jgi:hypothetical protein
VTNATIDVTASCSPDFGDSQTIQLRDVCGDGAIRRAEAFQQQPSGCPREFLRARTKSWNRGAARLGSNGSSTNDYVAPTICVARGRDLTMNSITESEVGAGYGRLSMLVENPLTMDTHCSSPPRNRRQSLLVGKAEYAQKGRC